MIMRWMQMVMEFPMVKIPILFGRRMVPVLVRGRALALVPVPQQAQIVVEEEGAERKRSNGFFNNCGREGNLPQLLKVKEGYSTMMSIRILIFIFLSLFAAGFSEVTYAADQRNTVVEKAAISDEIPQHPRAVQKLRFIDEDGDGLNDLIPDRNGDGIPDGRMRDGASSGNGSDRVNMYRYGAGSALIDEGAKRESGANAGGGFRHKSGQK